MRDQKERERINNPIEVVHKLHEDGRIPTDSLGKISVPPLPRQQTMAKMKTPTPIPAPTPAPVPTPVSTNVADLTGLRALWNNIEKVLATTDDEKLRAALVVPWEMRHGELRHDPLAQALVNIISRWFEHTARGRSPPSLCLLCDAQLGIAEPPELFVVSMPFAQPTAGLVSPLCGQCTADPLLLEKMNEQLRRVWPEFRRIETGSEYMH
jgi:hypothetical protein